MTNVSEAVPTVFLTATTVLVSQEALDDHAAMRDDLDWYLAHPEGVSERFPTAAERLMLAVYYRLRERLWRWVD